jgi:glycosyltransferase involved in cell wall biosynthesis
MSLRNLLIVSPHFPPTDTVDMHRVRMNARYYESHGWRPHILAVDPAQVVRQVDARLSRTVPGDIAIFRAGALPSALLKPLGVSDISLRAMRSMARAGDDIIALKKIDLVFISTTAFMSMRLGARWLRRFGTPFVLDFQDPWFTAPPSSIPHRRQGLKNQIMRRMHALAEARSVPHASGLIAVSEAYLEALKGAYPALVNVPSETIPFGYSANDFDVASELGEPWRPFGVSEPKAPMALYAGRIGEAMLPAIDALFQFMNAIPGDAPGALSKLTAGFLGTGYLREDNPREVDPRAKAAGLGARITERPDRVSMLDALSSLLAADFLILLGSADLSYQPSKLYQLMAAGKPILCIAPSAGRLAAQVRDLKSVVLIESDTPLSTETVAAATGKLSALLKAHKDDPVFQERDPICSANDAEALAARECALFDRAADFSSNVSTMGQVTRP